MFLRFAVAFLEYSENLHLIRGGKKKRVPENKKHQSETVNMSRAKIGAASEGQVPAQKEAAESPSSMEQLMKTMMEKMESMDKTVQGLKEEMNDRFQALESNQRSPVGNTGTQEEKSGERNATEVGGQELPHLNSSRG